MLLFPITTTCLGIWQIYRLQWKLNLIQQTTEILKLPPIDPGVIESDNLNFTKVSLIGSFVDQDMIVGPRSRGEGDVGYFVYTPFQRSNVPQRVIVNRGFIPRDLKDKVPRHNEQVTIHGMVKPSESAPFAKMAQNNPNSNSWGWVDLPAMAAWTNSSPVLIDQIRGGDISDEWPCPREARIDYRNQHLQYALTWFSLSALSTYMLVFGRRVGFRGRKVPGA
jgi:surfeit locus 1 family protein